MELHDYIRALRRSWWAPLLCAVVAATAALPLVGERSERSSAQIVVRTADDIIGEGGRINGVESIDGELMNTLADVLTSSAVVDSAAERAGIDPDVLAEYTVRATVGPESQIVTVASTGPDADGVQRLTEEVTVEVASVFAGLYDIYRIEVLEPAGAATPVGPSRVTVVGLAGLIGFVLGCLLAFAREWLAIRGAGSRSVPDRS